MSLNLQERVSLRPFNSFGIDAQAAWVAQAQDIAGIAQAHAFARERSVPLVVLGAGSNVLFAGDFPGVVLLVALRGVAAPQRAQGAWLVRVDAGEDWPALVQSLVAAGRGGLENLALIPGSAGAAPVQNIGAYGVELAERLHSVTIWEAATGACRELPATECGFGYRDSRFKRVADGAEVIVDITLRLPDPWEPVTGYAELERELAPLQGRALQPADVFAAVCAIRRRKLPDPARIGNAGSFFKNPVVGRAQHAALLEHHPSLVSYPLAGGRFKIAAGWLIESCGFKGATRGRAGVYEGQALVLVNRGGASGQEVLELAAAVRARVLDRFGVTLEPEVRVIAA